MPILGIIMIFILFLDRIMIMQGIIKVKSASYARYEELLLKKEALKKEAEEYRFQYDKIFGSLNNETYEARMDCTRKRKIISYCQSVISLGDTINKKELDAFVEKAMEDYKSTLAYLLEGDEPKNKSDTPTAPSKKAKTIYHRLAKLIHPDMNNDLKDDKTVQDLWNRAVIANNSSNSYELEEIEVLLMKYLESIHKKHSDIEIPNVEEKIFDLNRDIQKIIHTNPYQYKYILNNEDNIDKKREELSKELNDYIRYNKELTKEIEKFKIFETDDNQTK